MLSLIRHFILAALFFGWLAIVERPASAQFTKVGLIEMTDQVFALTVPTALPAPGILFVHNLDPNRKFTPQELTLDFPREAVSTLFLRYKDGKFTSLVLPNPSGEEGSEIKITGDFSIKVGPTATVSVSTANTPWYLTIAVYPPGKVPRILGFLGTNLIVKAHGPEQVALLQANQFSSTTAITPYLLAFDRVLLNDKPVTSKKIGVPLTDDSRNDCFQQDSHILDEEHFERFRSADLKGRLKVLRQSDARHKPEDYVTLSSNPKVKTVYDMRANSFGLVRLEDKMETRTICSFTALHID